MSETENRLEDVTVGIFLAPAGTEEVEFTEPKQAVADAGAAVEVLGVDREAGQTVNDDLEESESYEVDRSFDDVSAEEFDGLIVPGGTVGADKLRADEDAVALLREHIEAGNPAGAICHGPWALVEADVVVDDGLVTSRNPDDLEAFCAAIVEEFAAGSGGS